MSGNSDRKQLLKYLPSVDSVLSEEDSSALVRRYGRGVVVEAIRRILEEKRGKIMEGRIKPDGPVELNPSEIEAMVKRLGKPSIRKVINATGVVVHTNLGRAPIGESCLRYMMEVASGYCNLEYNLSRGRRGSRYEHIEELICDVTGAEAAHLVNNNAAAVFLVCSAIASGRDVVISRGELIEIGDSFRIPDIIGSSGARLVEVGTTNRTRISDYSSAINDRTALILKAHRSNFFMEGFVEEAPIEQIVALGRENSIIVAFDVGSGAFKLPFDPRNANEPDLRYALSAGADIVTASCDKLLGGAQAGLILGRKDVVSWIKRHPLTRVVRPCKLTIAIVSHLLMLYRMGRFDEIPVYSMLAQPASYIKKRALRFASKLRRRLKAGGWNIKVIFEQSHAGGGSLPASRFETWVVALAHELVSADELEEKLRESDPPIIVRIKDEKVLIDLRTVFKKEETTVVEAVAEIDRWILGENAGE